VKKWIVGVAVLAAALIAPRIAGAHEGHDHTVMGTISSIDGTNLMVKTADGKQTMVMMDAKTKITAGKAKLDVKALKVGDRVVASGPEEQSMIMAETVKVGAVQTVAKAPVATKK
jgi:lysyl-tRNA synthetase class II